MELNTKIQDVKSAISSSLEIGILKTEELIPLNDNLGLYNDYISIKGRFNELRKKSIQGIISTSENNLEENRIRNSLLQLIDNLIFSSNTKSDFSNKRVEENIERSWLEKMYIGYKAIEDDVEEVTLNYSEIINVSESEKKILIEELFISSEGRYRHKGKYSRKVILHEIQLDKIVGIKLENRDELPNDIQGNSIERYPSKIDLIYLTISLRKGDAKITDRKSAIENNLKEIVLIINNQKFAEEMLDYLNQKWRGAFGM